MPKTPQQLIEQATRHAAHLERLKSQEVKAIRELFDGMEEQILGRLSRQKVGAWTRDRLNRQLTGVRSVMRGQFDDEIIPALNKSIRDLAVYEAEFEMKSLGKVVDYNFDMPARDQILSAIRTKPLSVRGPDNGKLLTSFIKDWSESQVSRTANTIRSGFATGQATPQVIARLRDEVGPINRRGLEALTRTALQHCAVQAREQVWERNKDIVKSVRIVATLDSRTSTQCMALDSQAFPINEGPRPPFHAACRTTVVPELDERYKFLDDDATRRTRDPETGQVGRTDANETYYGWLKRQPQATQDSIIGPTRGKLLRDGGLTSQRFAELQLNKNFRPITLAEMKKLEPVAFERAGFSPKGRAILLDLPQKDFVESATTAKAAMWAKKNIGTSGDYNSHRTRFRGGGPAEKRKLVRWDEDAQSMVPVKGGQVVQGYGRKDMTAAKANEINRLIDKGNQVCDRIGVPRLRGVVIESGGGGAMGDGVLRIGTYGFAERQKRSTQMIYNVGRDPIEKRQAYTHWFHASKHDSSVGTFWHEMGHHIHQQYRVKNVSDYMDPPLERHLKDRIGMDLLKKTAPSDYAQTNRIEWFAENFSLYMTGHADSLSNEFLEIIEEILK